MLAKAILAAFLSTTLASGVVFAQSKSGSNDSMKSPSASQSQTVPEQIQLKLKNQGFSDVKVVPGSFLVSAKDKQGDPVTMVIGPHSMAIFSLNTPDNSSTVGSSSDKKNMPNKR